MKKRTELVLAGVGGQGLILMGKIIGEAAVIYEGKNAVQTQSYGVASRGGFSKSELVISDEEITYPEVLNPDMVLALSQHSFDMYRNKIKEDCLLIFDNSNIKPGKCSGKAVGYAITKAAVDLHSMKILNMISLGILAGLKESGVIKFQIPGYDSLKKSLEENTPSQYRDLNFKALEKGYKMAFQMPKVGERVK